MFCADSMIEAVGSACPVWREARFGAGCAGAGFAAAFGAGLGAGFGAGFGAAFATGLDAFGAGFLAAAGRALGLGLLMNSLQ